MRAASIFGLLREISCLLAMPQLSCWQSMRTVFASPARSRFAETMTYVVIVQRTPLQRDVYGPYRSFKTAEGDAKAWGGTVEPVMKPTTQQ